MTAEHEILVAVHDSRWRALGDVEALCRRAAEAALTGHARCEASVVLADDGFVRELNRAYRGKDEPTDVLAFEGGGEVLGDVVVAHDTALADAERNRGVSAVDHLAHLVVHGMLHLLGFDHQTDADAAQMEAREAQILAGLGIADPYAAAAPVTVPAGAGE